MTNTDPLTVTQKPARAEACVDAPLGAKPAAVYQILNKRADFMAASQARRQGTPAFLLQARERVRRRETQDAEPQTGAEPGLSGLGQPSIDHSGIGQDGAPQAEAGSRRPGQNLTGQDLAGQAPTPPLGPIRVGFTCSKKVGNAVARNRAKRRLREIARLVLAHEGRAGWDYVLVGRKDETASRDFQQLLVDLRSALARVHR